MTTVNVKVTAPEGVTRGGVFYAKDEVMPVPAEAVPGLLAAKLAKRVKDAPAAAAS